MEAVAAAIRSQRKFMLACFFAIVGSVALFIDKMSGEQYNFLVGTILALYGAANVADKRVQAIAAGSAQAGTR